MIKQHIRTILLDDSDVVSVVSNRVYVGIKPQGMTSNCIVLETTSEERIPTNSGETGLVESSIQCSCYVTGYLNCATLADYVRQALNCYSGTVDSTRIDVIYVTNKTDSFGTIPPGEDRPQYRIDLDLSVHWAEN